MPQMRKDDLVIPQGTTWAIRWPLLDSAGNKLNTTNWTVRSQVRRDFNDDNVLHEWSTEKGNASVFDSFVELRVSPLESSEWHWGLNSVLYDVEVTTDKGDVIRLTQGSITIAREITR